LSNKNQIDLDNGKYTFFLAEGSLYCLRNGKPWRDFIGDKATSSLFELALAQSAEIKRLQKHLWAAANQLEGVSLAVESHGKNINTAFFITEYKKNSDIARQALPHESTGFLKDDKTVLQDYSKVIAEKDEKILNLTKELKSERNRNPVYHPATTQQNDAPHCSVSNHLWIGKKTNCECGKASRME
jgi:hypothetical protein